MVVSLLLILGGASAILSSIQAQEREEYTISENKLSFSQPEMKRFVYKQEEQEIDNSEKDTAIIPARISIPAISVDAPIISTGLNEQKQMVVPDNGYEVAWFEPGRSPGAQGNAVLAGHVDDYTGPAVFFDLKELQPGDEIEITGLSGEILVFEVEKIESYPADDAPIREIFGPSNDKRLNVLTCTGLYNHETQDHEERLAVYTVLKEE